MAATTSDQLPPPRALGRPLCAVWTKQHTALEEDLTRRWAEGPANYITNNGNNTHNNSPGHGPIGVFDLRQFPWSFCCCCFQTAQRGRPRARGGQSPRANRPATSCQSPSGSWRPVICEGFFRRNQKTPLKCRDWSRRSTSNFETAFFKKVSNLKTFFLGFFSPHRWGHGTL